MWRTFSFFLKLKTPDFFPLQFFGIFIVGIGLSPLILTNFPPFWSVFKKLGFGQAPPLVWTKSQLEPIFLEALITGFWDGSPFIVAFLRNLLWSFGDILLVFVCWIQSYFLQIHLNIAPLYEEASHTAWCIPILGFFVRPLQFRRVQLSWQHQWRHPVFTKFCQTKWVNLSFTTSNMCHSLEYLFFKLLMRIEGGPGSYPFIKLAVLSWRMILVQNRNRCNWWSHPSFPYALLQLLTLSIIILTIFALSNLILKALKVVLNCEFNKCHSNQHHFCNS